MSTKTEPKVEPKPAIDAPVGFSTGAAFENIQRVARAYSESALVPKAFQRNIPNCIIALEMAQRMHASPFAIMQQLYVVHGKPSWSSQFVISCINTSGKFSPLRFKMTAKGKKKVEYSYTRYLDGGEKKRETGHENIEDVECMAWAKELATGDTLESPPVSIELAVKEGWYSKLDSKWKTMSDLMLRYRAATLFGRLYAPELLMGMKTADEIEDIDIKSANAHEVARAALPNFTAESVPEITQPGGGEKTEASSGEKTDPARAPGDGEGDAPAKAAPAAPGDNLGWEDV